MEFPGNARRYSPYSTFLTRLHVRYDRAHFPEDLTLNETSDMANFQGRYVMHHPFEGAANCAAGIQYQRDVAARSLREADSVADLTGWSRDTIKAQMKQSGEPLDYRRNLFDILFGK